MTTTNTTARDHLPAAAADVFDRTFAPMILKAGADETFRKLATVTENIYRRLPSGDYGRGDVQDAIVALFAEPTPSDDDEPDPIPDSKPCDVDGPFSVRPDGGCAWAEGLSTMADALRARDEAVDRGLRNVRVTNGAGDEVPDEDLQTIAYLESLPTIAELEAAAALPAVTAAEESFLIDVVDCGPEGADIFTHSFGIADDEHQIVRALTRKGLLTMPRQDEAKLTLAGAQIARNAIA